MTTKVVINTDTEESIIKPAEDMVQIIVMAEAHTISQRKRILKTKTESES